VCRRAAAPPAWELPTASGGCAPPAGCYLGCWQRSRSPRAAAGATPSCSSPGSQNQRAASPKPTLPLALSRRLLALGAGPGDVCRDPAYALRLQIPGRLWSRCLLLPRGAGCSPAPRSLAPITPPWHCRQRPQLCVAWSLAVCREPGGCRAFVIQSVVLAEKMFTTFPLLRRCPFQPHLGGLSVMASGGWLGRGRAAGTGTARLRRSRDGRGWTEPGIHPRDAPAGGSLRGGRNLGSHISQSREQCRGQSCCEGSGDEPAQSQGSSRGYGAGWGSAGGGQRPLCQGHTAFPYGDSES